MTRSQKWLTFSNGSAIGIEDRGTHRVPTDGCRYLWFLEDMDGNPFPMSSYDQDVITFDGLITYCSYLLDAWQSGTNLGVSGELWEVILAWIDAHLPELSSE